MSKEDDELRDIIRGERSRGRRRRVDVDAEKIQKEREAAVLKAFYEGSEDHLRELLRLWGVSDQEIEKKIRAFRDALEKS